MKKVNFISIVLVILLLQACVDMYLVETANSEKSVVVDALITNDSEEQKIVLSYSTQLGAPEFIPIKNADVVVMDKAGNIFEFTEEFNERGTYIGLIPLEYLVPGNSLKISINLQNDEGEYESTFVDILPSPPIDSVYYEINNDYYAHNSDYQQKGIEFFLDVKANQEFGSYYKWVIEETYEYHSTWPLEKYWAGEIRKYNPPRYKYFTCYKTRSIPSIAIATTANLDENLYLQYPLLFVSNETQRLYHRYSLFVKQLSIDEETYYYWESIKNNNQQSGGLFDSQPQQQKGNISCITRPNEKVLGLFSAASVSAKRININNNEIQNKLVFDKNVWCEPVEMGDKHWVYSSRRSTWPIYLAPTPEDESQAKDYYADPSCFDCRLNGGTLDVPVFWR